MYIKTSLPMTKWHKKTGYLPECKLIDTAYFVHSFIKQVIASSESLYCLSL